MLLAAAESEGGSILLPSIPDLVWGTIAFAVVLVVIIWKVLPNINRALDARRDAIEGGLKRAEEAQAGAQEALERYNAQLAEARAEAARIRDQAREDAKKIRAELLEQANADAPSAPKGKGGAKGKAARDSHGRKPGNEHYGHDHS